jgi:hypothetical protein
MHIPPLLPLRAALLGGALILLVAGCGESPPPVAPPQEGLASHRLIVPTVPAVGYVSAGDYHTCAVLPANALGCWGRDIYGESSPPAGIFVRVSAGALHTCAIRGDNSLVCWGHDSNGSLNPPSGSFREVSAGNNFACALRDDLTIACWGSNGFGQANPPSGTFIYVAVGDAHACAVALDQSLACWGNSASGQTTPPAGTFQRVVSGGSYSCAHRTDHTIVCWGASHDGRTSPPAGPFVRLADGYALKHACAIAGDHTLVCWGKNDDGESTPPSGQYENVSAGGHHTCAVRYDSSVTCWGLNDWGQGSVPSTRVAPTASFAATPSSVPAGGSFTLALTNAQVPGYPQATTFTYAFDCGDGAGYGAASPNASATCVGGTVGAQAVRGKVIDEDGDFGEYTATVDVGAAVQAITFTSQPPAPAILGGSYAVGATGGGSGNPVVFSSLTANICTVSGSTVSLNAIGTCTVAADQAGDATYLPAPQVMQSFAVVYGFPGFIQPVDNLPTMNTANAGQTVPIKFQLVDATGAPVTTLTTATVTVTTLGCSIGTTPDQLEEYVTGGSGLQNLGGGYYQFNWKTPKSYAKSCKTMHLDLGEGLTHNAYFQFK